MGERILMEEIYSLSIQPIQVSDQIRVICEECDILANYLLTKSGKEIYLCKIHLHEWLKTTKVCIIFNCNS